MYKAAILSIAAAMLFTGCASDGSFCPPDPLGRVIFTYLHKKAQERRDAMQQSDREVIQQTGQDTQYLNSSPQAASSTGRLPKEYLVTAARPPLQNEVQSPAPNYANPVWIDGYWKWSGSEWVWQSGKWTRRPYSKAEWITAQYYTTNGQNYWRDGYWK